MKDRAKAMEKAPKIKIDFLVEFPEKEKTVTYTIDRIFTYGDAVLLSYHSQENECERIVPSCSLLRVFADNRLIRIDDADYRFLTEEILALEYTMNAG